MQIPPGLSGALNQTFTGPGPGPVHAKKDTSPDWRMAWMSCRGVHQVCAPTDRSGPVQQRNPTAGFGSAGARRSQTHERHAEDGPIWRQGSKTPIIIQAAKTKLESLSGSGL